MSIFCVSARPAEYRNGMVLVSYWSGDRPAHQQIFHATKIAQIEEQIRRARAQFEGQSLQLYIRVLEGRKPNGFDRWKNDNRALFEMRGIVDTRQHKEDTTHMEGDSS